MRKIIFILFILLINLNLTACNEITKNQSTDQTNDNIAVINLNNSITIDGKGALLDGNRVSIIKGGTYHFSGTLENGYIDVNTKEIVTIIFNGVTISNPTGPCLLISDAKKVILELYETNTLSDSDSDNVNDATIFSNDTLVIDGDGLLIINGNHEEGISSDDDIIINGGTIKITSIDDGLNAKDNITINGGYVYIKANGDGIDSNGTININGGTIISLGSTKNNNGGIDATNSYTITGGTVIATGSKIVAPNSISTQASIYLTLETKESLDTLIHVEKDGNELLTFAPASNFKVFYFSSNSLNLGSNYLVNLGGSSTGSKIDGLYSGGTYTKGSFNTTLLASISPIGMEIPDGH
ncbi:MAG: hypothetical protein K0Q49_1455 [Haloplasmataceae bacterium]|jgi:hypothetical protein|nr:hypothetical protein [Haloplasmataceae bacterium]